MADAKKLLTLKQKRNGLRSHTKIVLARCKDTLGDSECSEEDLANCRDKLQTYQEKLQPLNDQIVDLIEEIEITGELSTSIEDALIELGNRLKKIAISSQCKDEVGVTGPLHTKESKRSFVNLPKLNITKFDGHSLHWKEFWESFEVSIHTNDVLSPVDKFNYLRTLLTGEAERSIRVALRFRTPITKLR